MGEKTSKASVRVEVLGRERLWTGCGTYTSKITATCIPQSRTVAVEASRGPSTWYRLRQLTGHQVESRVPVPVCTVHDSRPRELRGGFALEVGNRPSKSHLRERPLPNPPDVSNGTFRAAIIIIIITTHAFLRCKVPALGRGHSWTLGGIPAD